MAVDPPINGNELANQVASQVASQVATQIASQGDPLFINNSDSPGMNLTNTPFDGTNFLTWSRQLHLALRAKLKLSFIDGTGVRPSKENEYYGRWARCDSMVACWILNSMSPELSGAFTYTESARKLWLEISERYHQSSGPLIYQLQQELSQKTQVTSLSTACQEVMKAFKTEKVMHVVARAKGANFHFAGPFE